MNNEISRRDLVTRAASAIAVSGLLAAAGPLLGDTTGGTPSGGSPLGGAGFKDGVYVLPDLPYAYDALEPSIDAATMHLHHDKHHKAYVDGLNKVIKGLAELDAAGGEGNAPLLVGLQEDLSFNAGGHILHTLFWSIMGPNAGGEPPQPLADTLARDFGSVEMFRTRFARVAAGVKGSGWAVLAHEPMGDRLLVLQVKQHDLQLAPGAVPILALDVWEHAYYLKYHNVRADYVKAWWNVVNWPAVNAALAASRGR
jgi:Fe-Mn family superoxide dismutase